jgi:hypothetical protein
MSNDSEESSTKIQDPTVYLQFFIGEKQIEDFVIESTMDLDKIDWRPIRKTIVAALKLPLLIDEVAIARIQLSDHSNPKKVVHKGSIHVHVEYFDFGKRVSELVIKGQGLNSAIQTSLYVAADGVLRTVVDTITGLRKRYNEAWDFESFQ